MAKGFNLTAQINLQGPSNIKPVVAKIKRELGSISTNLDIKFDSKVAKSVQNLTGRLGALNTVLSETNRNSKDLAVTLSSLSTAFSSLGSASKTVSGISKTAQSVNSTAKAVKVATSEMAEFGKQSALAIRRFAAFSVVTSGVFSLINAINSGTQAFIKFDQELIKLRQITGAGAIGIKELETEITNLAINLGVSSEKLASVAIVLAQAGLSARETRVALAALAKTELAPSFENIEQTTEGAIAALRQFDIEVVDLEKALGSINAVAAAFAVESSDIVAAIQRAGGAFAASSKGVSEGIDALNEFIAVFTSVRATTRESAETIATGLRTIFTRIQRGSTVKFLKEFGVELTDAEGKFIGTFNAVQRLSEVLNTLDPRDLRFAQIVEELGGFRQIGKVIPLIQQFGEAQKALGVAQRGQSSLAENQVTAQLALANQIARVREEFLALVRSIGQSQTFQVLFKTILGITSGLIKLASVFKPILPLLTILGGIKGFGALSQFAGGFIGGIRRAGGAGDVGENIGAGLSGAADKTRSEATERATSALSNNTDSLKALTSAVESLTQAINTKLGGSGGTTLNEGGRVWGFARGGSVPGSGSGDKVKALLEPNEYVLNRKTVQRIGKSRLDSINNKFAFGGKVKDLAEYYASIPYRKGYEDLANQPIRDNSIFREVLPNELSEKEILEWRGSTAPRWKKFENLLASKYGNLGSPAPERFALLDFPESRSEAKFMKRGDTYADPDSIKGNNEATIAAKNFLYENSLLSGQKNIKPAELLTRAIAGKPVTTYWADPDKFQKAGLFNSGGLIQKFADGSPRGVRSTANMVRGARGSNIFWKGFRLPLSYEDIATLSTAELLDYGRSNEFLDYLSSGGSGIAVKKLVKLPDTLSQEEIDAFGSDIVKKADGYYSEIEEIYKFRKAKSSAARSTENTKLGREEALSKQVSRYADEVAARDQRWTSISDNSVIDKYLSSSLEEPILSDYKTVRGGGSLSKQFHNTRLRQAVNKALDNYDDFDYNPSNIDKLVSGMAAKRFADGGLVRNFRLGGIQEPLSLEEAKKQSAGEIVSELSSIEAKQILERYWSGAIPPDPNKPSKITKQPTPKEALDASKVKEWNRKYAGSEFLTKINEAREALYEAYQKKVNTRRGASAPLSGSQIQQATESGLLFGVAGMYGNPFPPRKLELIPGQTQDDAVNKLKAPVTVSLVGGVLARNEAEKQKRFQAQVASAKGLENLGDRALDLETAPTQQELSQKFGEKASLYAIQKANKERAISYVNAIAKALDPSSGGSQIFLDFDKTLAFGADRITRRDPSGRPDYSAFSDPVEIQKGLSKAKLSRLGSRLKDLARQSDEQQAGLGSELLNRMFVVSARPPETMGLIAQWLQSQGLNIPSSNVVGVGGSGKSPNDIAISKAEEILSRLSGNRSIFIDDDLRNIDTARTKGLRAVQYGADIDKKARKDAQDREGTSFEKFVRENLPPALVRAMTSQTGESIDYPKGLGETVAAWFNQPLLSNAPTDVKRTVSGIGKVKSNIANYLRKTLGYKLGGQVYDLQTNTGLSNGEFDQLVKYANTNNFNITEFKKYLDEYLKQKKAKADLRVDPMSLLRAITPERSSSTQRQMDLAKQLMGEPDPQYRPRRYAKGGHVNAMLTPGEAVISPQMAKRIGYAKLDKMNYADKNNMNKYAFGGGVSIVPGSGNGDTFGPVPLPVGSYVIRKKATEALGFNKGGSVGSIQKFAGGRRVGVIAEDRRLAELFKQLSSNIRGGMTSADAFDRVVESARTDFPEAANLLREAAEAFKSGAGAAAFAPFGGELARRAPDSFASFPLEADAFADLAKIVNSAADTMDLFAIEATDAGSSLETFESNLKKRLQEQVLGREAQRRSSRIDLGRQIIRSRSTDASDPAALAATLDEVRVPLTALIGTLKDADPTAIEDTLQAIVSGSAAGESLQELRDRLPLLNQAFDNTIDRTAALAEIESEAVDALGGLTASVRSTIEELDALDYKKSGQARQEFGAAGEFNPAGALRFKRSAVGGGLLRTAQSFQDLSFVPIVGKSLGGLNKVLGQLPGPIGNAVRAIGGLPGALAAVASIIGTSLLPQLGEFLGLAEDANFAGIAGGVGEGGSMAVSLGTIGQQVGGQVGALVGTIGGAVVGFFKGYTEAFRRQELTNALKGLTSATDKAKVALDNLSKYDSAENAQAVQKATIETEVAARKLEELSQRTTGERATDTAIYAGAGTVIAGIIAAALAPFTGGLSVLATAGILGAGAVAGGVYGGTQGPSEMDNEALKSYLDSLTTINDTLSNLAQRDIKFKSLEDLNAIIDGFRDSAGNIDNAALGKQSEYIRQAQEGALRAAGFTINSTESLEAQLRTLGSGAQQLADATAAQYAYQAGLEELNRQLNGNLVAVRAATDTEEEKQAITRRGFERIGEERRQLALQQRLALIARQVSIETENLADTYNKLLAALQRYNDTLNQTDSAIANATDILLNQSDLNKVSRSDQQVLQNARAYSPAELDKVLQRVADLAGGGERGKQLTDAVRGRRIVEDELPQILRNVTQRNIGDVTGSIVELFEKAGIGREVTNALIDEIENVLESETGGRQGKSFDELVQQFPSLQKAMETMEKANESAIALLESQSNLYDKVIDRLNAYSDAIQRSTEWTIKASDIRIQAENELAKALGRSISLDNLNKAFNQQIEALTRDLAGGLQGTTNPAEIAGRIRANQRTFEANQRAIREQPSTPQGRQTVADLLKQQEKLKTSSANLYQALEKLATSGDNASNALNKLQERRQISENATDLLERVFTQGAEEADRMFRSFGALQDALGGRLMFGNQNERVLAFEGLRTLLPLLSSEIGNQLRAAVLEGMLKGNKINPNDTLIPGIGGQGKFTYNDILNNLRNPEADPATKALIDSYLQANELMRNAAVEISKLNQEAADKFLQATDRLLSIPLPGLGNQANAAGGGMNQMAADIRTFTNAATQRGSIYTHDINSEELLRQLVSRNNGNNNGPIIGANNLDVINLPVFEKISTVLPDINTELLNVVKAFEIFNTTVADLSQVMNNLINSNNKNGASSGTKTTVESLNLDMTTFANAAKEFGGYITRLERIKFPEKITMGGSYTLDVRVSGAAAFQSLEEKTRDLIDTEISSKIKELEERIARSTGYSVDPRRREP